LLNKGHDFQLIRKYLGHSDPKHTMAYYELCNNSRFEDLWRDQSHATPPAPELKQKNPRGKRELA
jgi:site-specific recombinase XerD